MHVRGDVLRGDGTVSNCMEKLVTKTCPWAENLKKKKCIRRVYINFVAALVFELLTNY